MVATLPGTSVLSRRKSISRYILLLPPPRNRSVILPCALRPPVLFNGATRDFSGLVAVISSNVETDRNRRLGVVGLYCRSGIGYNPSNIVIVCPDLSVTMAFFQSLVLP